MRTELKLLARLAQMMASGDRSQKARYVLNHLEWSEPDDIPEAFLTQLFPESRATEVTVGIEVDHPYELPYGERLILAFIAQATTPKSIFEFGTFTGRTTKLLADAAPEATVHTLDLPEEEIKWEHWMREVIGVAFRDDPAYRGRILQHRANSRTLDFAPFVDAIDMVYIDASHAYPDVVHDSQRALEMLSPGGVVVWDDYQAIQPGVVRALRELAQAGTPVTRVAGSRLAVYCAHGERA